MLVFAISDKGGTGRSVTSSNIVYRRALDGNDVCYLDFDFGSPTAGAIFNVSTAERGTDRGGMHSYLQEKVQEPYRIDIWAESDRGALRGKPPGAGQLVLFPGDSSGGEFRTTTGIVQQCVRLFLLLQEEFDLCLIDLSAGRSYAADMVLAATAHPELAAVPFRWLVYHRWTRQHIIAASGLVYDKRGLLEVGAAHGHDKRALAEQIRFVRTAVVEPSAPELSALRSTQLAWLDECNRDLHELARRHRVGRTAMLGKVPLDPVLQWREQLIVDEDVYASRIANENTIKAFDDLATKIFDVHAWEGL
ncbi:SCO2523 family variant P-loop protein [Sphaerisporangium sp. NPDC049002]|uniref:SCO2523 family variant P-loop protein n=1 Tax=unclassified Sphaerisporangium TaxID=2630420 RepID=UPI0033E941E4